MVFINAISGPAGRPINVTVYDQFDVPMDPASVTWTGMPAGVTATPDMTTTPPSFKFESTIVGTQMGPVHARSGLADGALMLTFTAPPIKFSSP